MAQYNFTSPGAMAAKSIEEFLLKQALMQRQQEQDSIAEQERIAKADRERQEFEFRNRQFDAQTRAFEADEAERARVAARQTRQDDMAAASMRQTANAAGVRQMAMEGLRGGQAPGIIQQMMFGETGETIPADIIDPDRATRQDERNHQQAIELARIQGEESRRTVAANRAAETNPTDAGADYAAHTASRVIQQIDQVLPKINGWTAGIGGNALAKIGLSQNAVDVQAELEGIAGNIAFNALQEMRNASKTGGALGSIAQQELRLLQSVEGSIRQDRRPENLVKQLNTIRESMQRFQAAQGLGGQQLMERSGGPAAPSGRKFTILGVK